MLRSKTATGWSREGSVVGGGVAKEGVTGQCGGSGGGVHGEEGARLSEILYSCCNQIL